MSESTGKETPGTGAVPKDTQNKKKRSSKNKNKYRETETGTGEIVQAGSESLKPTEEIRCKKRNKSVSFAIEDEGTSKKSKDDPAAKNHESRVFRNSRMKKHRKNGDQVDDENEISSSTDVPALSKKHKLRAPTKAKYEKMDTDDVKDESNTECDNPPKKRKKPKRSKTASNELTIKRTESNSEDEMTMELENLQISPKQNNLTSLLDDMVPSSRKLKKKKLDRQLPEPSQTDINSNVSDDFDLKKVVKWTKKRWNKDKKGASVLTNQRTSVVVQDLPKTMSSAYQKQLADVFEKCGRIKRIGPAESQPEKDGAVFSTMIYFETEEAANKALDFVSFEGSAIRVSRPLPPSETTVVARCFSQLTVEELRAIFGGAGALLNVRVDQRRGGRMAVAFLEFDGPVAVHCALALSGTAKINGKPVYVNKFEVRD